MLWCGLPTRNWSFPEFTKIADPSMPKCQKKLKTNVLRFFAFACGAIASVSYVESGQVVLRRTVSNSSHNLLERENVAWYVILLEGYIGCFKLNHQRPEVSKSISHSFFNTGLEEVEAKARMAVFCSRLIALNSMPTPTEVILETTE
jgi:hypothetical protein